MTDGWAPFAEQMSRAVFNYDRGNLARVGGRISVLIRAPERRANDLGHGTERLSFPMQDQSTQWRPVVGYEGRYEVSDKGDVRRVSLRAFRNRWGGVTLQKPTQATIAGEITPQGYRHVILYRDGGRQWHYVHSLVATAFIGPCPDGHEVNHIDTVKLNNRATNLEYLTKSQNAKHAIENGHWPERGKKGRYGTDW